MIVLLNPLAQSQPVSCCEDLAVNLGRISKVEIQSDYDSTITARAHEMAYINQNYANMLRGSSQIYLDCMYRIVDFDNLIIFEFASHSTVHSPCERILYDSLTSQYYAMFYTDIKEFSYILKAHQNSSGFKDMLKNLHLYHILQSPYDCLFKKDIIDSKSDSISRYPKSLLKGLFDKYEKDPQCVDEHGKEYFIQICAYIPGDYEINVIKAHYRDGYFIKYETETVNIEEK